MYGKKKLGMITVDGQDGVGKTTAISQLTMLLEEAGKKVHNTRALGGDKGCDFQTALRQVLLHKKFPHDSVELEEKLFAMADQAGLDVAKKFLAENPESVVLKDRGMVSHYVYALSKMIPMAMVQEVFSGLLSTEIQMNDEVGTLNLVLVADDAEWPLRRIAERAEDDKEQILDRMENLPFQRKVAQYLKEANHIDQLRNLDIKVIEVSEADTISDVRNKVLNVLSQYDLGVELKPRKEKAQL